MNTSGLLQSKWSPTSGLLQSEWSPSGFTYFARDPKYSWFHEHYKNWIYYLFLHFIIDIFYIEIIQYHFGNKTVLFLICNRINSFVERKAEQPVWRSKEEACFERATQVWLAINRNCTSGEWILCSKRIARAAVNQIL